MGDDIRARDHERNLDYEQRSLKAVRRSTAATVALSLGMLCILTSAVLFITYDTEQVVIAFFGVLILVDGVWLAFALAWLSIQRDRLRQARKWLANDAAGIRYEP